MRMQWIGADADFDALAAFFQANVDPGYISHGEILAGRALGQGEWSPDMRRVLAREMRQLVENRVRTGGGVAVAEDVSGLLALVMIDVRPDSGTAVLEDVVVRKDARGLGLGQSILAWVEAEAKRAGCARIMLESGVANTRAHVFFERHGFSPVSVVMLKDLSR